MNRNHDAIWRNDSKSALIQNHISSANSSSEQAKPLLRLAIGFVGWELGRFKKSGVVLWVTQPPVLLFLLGTSELLFYIQLHSASIFIWSNLYHAVFIFIWSNLYMVLKITFKFEFLLYYIIVYYITVLLSTTLRPQVTWRLICLRGTLGLEVPKWKFQAIWCHFCTRTVEFWPDVLSRRQVICGLNWFWRYTTAGVVVGGTQMRGIVLSITVL